VPLALKEALGVAESVPLCEAVAQPLSVLLAVPQALGVVTHRSAELLGASARAHQASPGRLELGCQADLCVFDPAASWRVTPQALRSQGKHTLFDGYELPGRVHHTVVGGRLVFSAAPAF
jgi:dihydroorotase